MDWCQSRERVLEARVRHSSAIGLILLLFNVSIDDLNKDMDDTFIPFVQDPDLGSSDLISHQNQNLNCHIGWTTSCKISQGLR